jgi:HEAT repeat protein
LFSIAMGLFTHRKPNVKTLAKHKDVAGLADAATFEDLLPGREGGAFDMGAQVREEAILALGALGPEAGNGTVTAALADPADRVRVAAVRVLYDREAAGPLSEAVGWLPAGGGHARRLALEAIAELRRPDSVRTLAGALVRARGSDPVGDQEGELLATLLRSVESSAVTTGVIEELLCALADEREIVADRAEELLAKLAPISVDGAIAELKGGSAPHRAATVLGRIGDTRAMDPLVEALEHRDPRARAASAAALGELRDPAAVDPLMRATRDSDHTVRAQAGGALDRIGAMAIVVGVSHLVRPMFQEAINPASEGTQPVIDSKLALPDPKHPRGADRYPANGTPDPVDEPGASSSSRRAARLVDHLEHVEERERVQAEEIAEAEPRRQAEKGEAEERRRAEAQAAAARAAEEAGERRRVEAQAVEEAQERRRSEARSAEAAKARAAEEAAERSEAKARKGATAAARGEAKAAKAAGARQAKKAKAAARAEKAEQAEAKAAKEARAAARGEAKAALAAEEARGAKRSPVDSAPSHSADPLQRSPIPQSKRRAVETSRTSRRLLILAAIFVGTAVGIAIAATTGDGKDDGQLRSDALSLRLPAGWDKTELTRGGFVPLSQAVAATAGGGAGMVAGLARDAESVLDQALPAGASRTAVQLGPLQAWRYPDLRPGRGLVGVAYLAYTSGGQLLIVCHASPADASKRLSQCGRAAATVRLDGERPIALAVVERSNRLLRGALASLKTARLEGRRAFATAPIASEQAAAAKALQESFRAAAQQLDRIETPPGTPSLTALVALLEETAGAYGALGEATAKGDASGYDRARQDVIATEAKVRDEVARVAPR